MSESSTPGTYDCQERLYEQAIFDLAERVKPSRQMEGRKLKSAERLLGKAACTKVAELLKAEIDERAGELFHELKETTVKTLTEDLQGWLTDQIQGDIDYPEEFCIDAGQVNSDVVERLSAEFAAKVFAEAITDETKEQWLERCAWSWSGTLLENFSDTDELFEKIGPLLPRG